MQRVILQHIDKIKLALAAFLCMISLSAVVTPSVFAATGESKNDVCEGLGSISSGNNNCGNAPGPSVNKIVTVVVNLISIVAGVIAVIMIIVAGFNYITSSGDPTKISHAKDSLIYAMIGLVIVALAQFIVQYALARASKA